MFFLIYPPSKTILNIIILENHFHVNDSWEIMFFPRFIVFIVLNLFGNNILLLILFSCFFISWKIIRLYSIKSLIYILWSIILLFLWPSLLECLSALVKEKKKNKKKRKKFGWRLECSISNVCLLKKGIPFWGGGDRSFVITVTCALSPMVLYMIERSRRQYHSIEAGWNRKRTEHDWGCKKQ